MTAQLNGLDRDYTVRAIMGDFAARANTVALASHAVLSAALWDGAQRRASASLNAWTL